MQYVEAGDFNQAVTSMLSDLGKHEDTKASSSGTLATIGIGLLMRHPLKEEVVHYINGFN